ncbi:Decapping nuclease rai1 [Sphaceloma murrayae]|uniref:Decapping nuclease n=1 Tax=Sphaceloma murrayae TaxID=2082308 RepID=A0A2K1QKL3_9PEZI|nr:Decapping nuclease rai1 [Sphaceloma murrayae]
MQEFRIDHNLDQRGKVNIKRPREIAFFSFDDKHQIRPFSVEGLRYYYPPFFNVPYAPPPRPIDMSTGYEDMIYHDGSAKDEHLDALLDTMEELERRNGKRCEVDFVTWRGMMTKIVTAPFEKDGWEMFATKYQDTIYIEDSYEHKLRRQPVGRYKYEALSMLDQPLPETTREMVEDRPNRIVDTTSQYLVGYKPETPDEPPRWVELKTTREPTNDHGQRIFAEKLLKFWAQSFLIGCPTIAVGWRSQDGFLYKTTEFETQKIPSQAKASGHCFWNANVCLANAAAFLAFLKGSLEEGGVYRIYKTPREGRIGVVLQTQFGGGTGDIVKESFKAWRQSAECANMMSNGTARVDGDLAA